jgi:hypothetical protein
MRAVLHNTAIYVKRLLGIDRENPSSFAPEASSRIYVELLLDYAQQPEQISIFDVQDAPQPQLGSRRRTVKWPRYQTLISGKSGISGSAKASAGTRCMRSLIGVLNPHSKMRRR